jgi:hypothetical protein
MRSGGIVGAFRVPSGTGDHRWVIAGSFGERGTDATWRTPSGGIKLSRDGPGGTFLARLCDVVPGVTLQGSACDGGREGEGAVRGGVRISIRSRLKLQGSYGRSGGREILTSDLYESPVVSSVHSRVARSDLDAEVRLPLGVLASGWLRNDRSRVGRGVGRDGIDAIRPEGSRNQSEITLLHGDVRRLLIRRMNGDLDIAARAFRDGQQYGLLNYARGLIRSTLIGFESCPPFSGGSRWLFDIEHARVSGAVRAEIEGWPFLDGLLTFLGTRRVFKGTAAMEWVGAHAGWERSFGRTRSRAGIEWFGGRGNYRIKSWRPSFLVFGQSDVRDDRRTFDRAMLGLVSFGLTREIGSVQIGADIRQAVYGRITSSGAASTDGDAGSPGSGGHIGDSGGRNWPGGTEAALRVTIGER